LLPDQRSDEALLRAFIHGDMDAFDPLMRRHEDKIFALATRMTGNRHDALDATQEAFISAFKNAKKFKGDSAFSTWLYRIAVNACTDLLRRKQRQVPVEDIELRNQSAVVNEDIATRVDLQRALQELSPDHREAVVMHDLGGYPYEDIAVATGVQLGTVKSRISRGRKKLAEVLEQGTPRQASKETT
jgi:RNA polymerase sigma-70 factor (ECF subfamily)